MTDEEFATELFMLYRALVTHEGRDDLIVMQSRAHRVFKGATTIQRMTGIRLLLVSAQACFAQGGLRQALMAVNLCQSLIDLPLGNPQPDRIRDAWNRALAPFNATGKTTDSILDGADATHLDPHTGEIK